MEPKTGADALDPIIIGNASLVASRDGYLTLGSLFEPHLLKK